jgi:hypothetical protein
MNDRTSLLIVCLVKVVKAIGKVRSDFVTIIFLLVSIFICNTVASFDSVFVIHSLAFVSSLLFCNI